MLCAVMANLHNKPNGRPFEPGDFFPSVPIEHRWPTPEELVVKTCIAFGIDPAEVIPSKAR